MEKSEFYGLYGGKVKLEFQREPYHKFLIDGNWVPSVTSITKIVDKSAALVPWAVRLAKEYLIDKLVNNKVKIGHDELLGIIEQACLQHKIKKEAAADAGTLVHQWVEDFTTGKNPKMPTDPKVKNGVVAFLGWADSLKIKFLEAEKVIYSRKYNFAGVCDAIAQIGKDLVLLDYKTSSGVYPEMWLQVAAYQLAYTEETGKEIKYRVIARFDKMDGSFEHVELNDYKADRDAFLAALKLSQRIKSKK